MPDDAVVLLGDPGQVAGDVHEGHDWQVEGVAVTDEAAGLVRGIDVEAARHDLGLIGDDPDGRPRRSRWWRP